MYPGYPDAQSKFWSYVAMLGMAAFVLTVVWLGVMSFDETTQAKARLGCDYYAQHSIDNVPVNCYKHFGLTQVVK